MAGNSWQQPVAGEPSCGTFHTHKATILSSNTVADTNWHSIDISGEVPVGTKAVALWAIIKGNAANQQGIVASTNSAAAVDDYAISLYTNVSGAYISGFGIMYMDDPYNVWWKGSTASMDYFTIIMAGYYI